MIYCIIGVSVSGGICAPFPLFFFFLDSISCLARLRLPCMYSTVHTLLYLRNFTYARGGLSLLANSSVLYFYRGNKIRYRYRYTY